MSHNRSVTRDLIRKLSRRQRVVSVALVALALGFLFIGWHGLSKDGHLAETLNLAGRQRMLSQRMAMHLVLEQRAPDRDGQRHYREIASVAATEFGQAHERLAEKARTLGPGSAIHSLYFGPAGSLDAKSRLYLSQVRAALAASAQAKSIDEKAMAAIMVAASEGLIKELHQVTVLYQQESERSDELMLRLLQASTLLMVSLVAFGTFRIFGATIRRLEDDIAARDHAEGELQKSEERFKAFSESTSDWFWETDAEDRFVWFRNGSTAHAPVDRDKVLGRSRTEFLSPQERAQKSKWRRYQADIKAHRPFRDLEYQLADEKGMLRSLSVSGGPHFDAGGTFLGYRGTAKDVTAGKTIAAREEERKRILETMATGAPLAKTLGDLVRMAEAELAGGICTIQRLDRVQGKLFSACASTLPDAYVSGLEGAKIGEGAGSCGTAAFRAERVIVEDIDRPPHWQPFRDLATGAGLRACWSQPIMAAAGQVLGTLTIYYRRPHVPGTAEIEVIEMIASLAAICMEKEEAEQALRRQEEERRELLAEHQTILNNAMVGIVYLKHRRVVSCNRRLEQIFGYEAGELIGESSERFYDTPETFEATGDEAYQVVAEGRNYSTELMLKHKDGSLFRGALNGCALDPARPHEGSIWVYADISERYYAEQEANKLRQAVEQSPVSIVITNREGLIEYVNPRFTRVTGYRAAEVLGRNPRILQSGETPSEIYRQLWQSIIAGKEWRGVVRNRRKNGELFWEEASISPILDPSGEITHFLAVKEDITERKRIEDELEQHHAQLENLVIQRTADLSAALEAAKEADKAKDAFLANVSHELRTPLNAVVGLSELARRVSTDPRQREYLDKAAGAGRTLANIINDLLDFSKISAGRMELEPSTFSLRQLVERSKSVMTHRADEKGLALCERVDDEVPDVLVGDPLRIEQILLNLLSNAIKFTPAGRVELRIRLDGREAERVCLAIDVDDTGIGLAEDVVARLFQPFVQADASMNRKFGGTGLGLALCRRLAEMMDGDIGVTSREGTGSTFHVRLWLSLGDSVDLAANGQTSPGTSLPDAYQGARVLLVDDQPLNREVVDALLAEVGITSRSAGNGREALDILRAEGADAFDLVLMDIQMPIIDGLTATREIRRWPGFSRLPIIAMTAHIMEHELEVSTAAGMNGHLGKPFETEDFFALLARWIPDSKQQRRPPSTDTASLPQKAGLAALRGIDTQGGLARFAGNETRYRHWLREFLKDAPGYATEIRRLIAAAKAEAARQSAHAIKGRVGMLGMADLHADATALEAALIHNQPADELLERMQTSVEALCREIRAGIGEADSTPEPPAEPGVVPSGAVPEPIDMVIGMLQCADGDSADAIERCLSKWQGTDWEAPLRQALIQARRFDFPGAHRILSPASTA